MASSASERTDGEAINQVARDCGSLSIECSDVAGYVAGVNERISRNLKMLDSLEEVTTRLMADQARVADSTDEARVLAEQARDKLSQGRAAIEETVRILALHDAGGSVKAPLQQFQSCISAYINKRESKNVLCVVLNFVDKPSQQKGMHRKNDICPYKHQVHCHQFPFLRPGIAPRRA